MSQAEAGKGSRPRPYSISYKEFTKNWDSIFTKNIKDNTKMTQRTCGCGRSPTGMCIGWHSLTKEEYEKKLVEHNNYIEVTAEEDEYFNELAKKNK